MFPSSCRVQLDDEQHEIALDLFISGVEWGRYHGVIEVPMLLCLGGGYTCTGIVSDACDDCDDCFGMKNRYMMQRV